MRLGKHHLSDSWEAFEKMQSIASLESKERRAKELLTSTSSSRPFLSQQGKRQHRFDLLPYCIDGDDWEWITRGIEQRTRCLNALLDDLYGEQRLCRDGLVDLRKLYQDPAFLLPLVSKDREMRPQLRFFNVRLVQTQNGFKVLGDLTSTPQGLGAVLEHRLISNRIFRPTQDKLRLVRIAPWFKNYREQLYATSLDSDEASFGAVLSGGINGDGYEEHAYLAHYLGLPMVEASDLTVRQSKVFLKNLGHLQRVNFLLRRVPDQGIDPLEMRHPQAEGIGGLVQALREQNVTFDVPLGVGIVQSPFLFESMPAICRALLGEELLIPQIYGQVQNATFWPELKDQSFSYQAYELRLCVSKMGNGSELLPGGLAHSLLTDAPEPTAKDIWVCGSGSQAHDTRSLLTPENHNFLRMGQGVTSRVADATIWFGRYLERADILARILREILLEPEGEEGREESEGRAYDRLEWVCNALDIPLEFEDEESWEDRWLQLVRGEDLMGNLYFNLLGVQHNAMVLRDRISADMLQIAGNLARPYQTGLTLESGEWKLTRTLEQLAALTGLSTDSMTHRDEWNFLVMGRRMERASSTLFLLETLWSSRAQLGLMAWELLLRTFDCIMTYRWRYHLQLYPTQVVEMMVKDVTNPRSVAYQCRQIMLSLQALSDEGASWAIEMRAQVRLHLEKIQSMDLDSPSLEEKLSSYRSYFLDLHTSLNRILLST